MRNVYCWRNEMGEDQLEALHCLLEVASVTEELAEVLWLDSTKEEEQRRGSDSALAK